ncbi:MULTISPECIES: hypothetical protein [Enterobacteriaceae]|jgi:hypothetical protein|uniref:Uncharacterized protein n=1 Tax=Intestinirhabdus alba TaxID=2899544 RepID=A0A6L6IUH9_9ENTR|nr:MULTISPECIES: hypothetical protein [Enterobacteriaceae]EHM4904047.1 hypothetical protein [Salmonella enterica]MTH48670.1 hypothetical protein [Intestinirhabdus alba]
MKKDNAVNDDVYGALHYADGVRRTEEALHIIRTTMPDPTVDLFTDGYLQGVLFHWRLLATEAGLPAGIIDTEYRRLLQLAGHT